MRNPFGRFFRGNRYDSALASVPTRQQIRAQVGDAPDELTAYEREQIVNWTRDRLANDGALAEIVEAYDLYSVGDGIYPQPATKDNAWNDKALAIFMQWAKSVDVAGTMDLHCLESLFCKYLDVDGEAYIVKTIDGEGQPKLKVFETHRIADTFDDPDQGWRQGILFDRENGKPLAYKFFGGLGKEPFDIEAQFVIHVFSRQRATDIHGVSNVQRAIATLTDANELLALVKARAKLQQSFAIRVESDRIVSGGNTGELLDAPQAIRSNADALKAVIPGKVAVLQEGEKIEPFITNAPDKEFLEAYNGLRKIACGGLYEFLVAPGDVNGASVRLVVAKAGRLFARRQQILIREMLTPIYNFVIGNAIKQGKLDAIENFLDVEWACPRSITVDAGRERAQDREDVFGGFNTWTDYYAEHGKNFTRDMRLHAQELRQIADLEKEFNLPAGSLIHSETTASNISSVAVDGVEEKQANTQQAERETAIS